MKMAEKHKCMEDKLTEANNESEEKYDILVRKLIEMQARIKKVMAGRKSCICLRVGMLRRKKTPTSL